MISDSPVLAFLAGDRSVSTLDALADAIRRWAAQDPDAPQLSLHRHLGIKPTPCKMRKELRDIYIREAARHLPRDMTGSCYLALYEVARAFEIRRWPRWQRFDEPPATASDLDVALDAARRWAPFPNCSRQFYNILTA